MWRALTELIYASRALELVVFAVLVGFLFQIVTDRSAGEWRRLMAAAFIVLSLGVSVRQAARLAYREPWSWWGTFALVASILAVVGFYLAWRDRER